jgi:hypothetical protein
MAAFMPETVLSIAAMKSNLDASIIAKTNAVLPAVSPDLHPLPGNIEQHSIPVPDNQPQRS